MAPDTLPPASRSSLRRRLDQIGLGLAGLCAVHCLATLLVISALGVGGHFLFDENIHRVGLALAIAVGAVTLVIGVVRHRDPRPLQVGAAGLALMAIALFIGHGTAEALLTIAGVSLLAWAHWRNLRLSH